ncbi:MAG: SMC-Scp complex subunit ScpB [Deltaproteobacteria bacterium]|nr:MAG: SMC-Scp complex subunit ScpB [Deltaproteobacteria bacterium]
MTDIRIRQILEGLLFSASEPLSIKRLEKLLPEFSAADIQRGIKELSDYYDAQASALFLAPVSGGYQIRTRAHLSNFLERLHTPVPARLSKAALETLAIIAYKQPVIRNEVEHIRGVDCGSLIRLLLEKKLIAIAGRKALPGRPLIYRTTPFFLSFFGLSRIEDLPAPEEIASLGFNPTN